METCRHREHVQQVETRSSLKDTVAREDWMWESNAAVLEADCASDGRMRPVLSQCSLHGATEQTMEEVGWLGRPA